MSNPVQKNRIYFGVGTIGRDMVYSLVSLYLVFYLTDVARLPNGTLWWITGIMLFARVFDALNDPVMGLIVDNTQTRFGKFKPWIAFGSMASGILTILLFVDVDARDPGYVVMFAFIYILWGISYTTNDIAYWSMMPALSINQKEREKLGAFARICASTGLFVIVSAVVPLSSYLGRLLGDQERGWLALAVLVVFIMWAGQSVMLIGVQEPRSIFRQESKTTLRELAAAIFLNDQLLYTTLSMALFMIGQMTTVSFGLYYFKYVFGNERMYSIFAIILGVAQVLALSAFPFFSSRFSRKSLYTGATGLVVLGYFIFFFSPANMISIAIAGIPLFLGQSFIQLLMLMFLADSIEYGQWKLGRRNASITFAMQPLINKLGGAVSSSIVSVTIILSGINEASSAADVSNEGIVMMKSAMLILPLLCIVSGFLLWWKKYRIDPEMYAQILGDLRSRGHILKDGKGTNRLFHSKE